MILSVTICNPVVSRSKTQSGRVNYNVISIKKKPYLELGFNNLLMFMFYSFIKNSLLLLSWCSFSEHFLQEHSAAGTSSPYPLYVTLSGLDMPFLMYFAVDLALLWESLLL